MSGKCEALDSILSRGVGQGERERGEKEREGQRGGGGEGGSGGKENERKGELLSRKPLSLQVIKIQALQIVCEASKHAAPVHILKVVCECNCVYANLYI